LLVDSLLVGRPAVAADALRHLVLPAAVLSTYNLGILARLMRGSTLDVLGEDYVRTARAKGLAERAVTLRHAARNALIPVVTVIGLSFGRLLSGAVIIESVFAWPGLGFYAFRTATSLDFPAIMGVGVVVATIYVLANLIVDVAYALIDPPFQVGPGREGVGAGAGRARGCRRLARGGRGGAAPRAPRTASPGHRRTVGAAKRDALARDRRPRA